MQHWRLRLGLGLANVEALALDSGVQGPRRIRYSWCLLRTSADMAPIEVSGGGLPGILDAWVMNGGLASLNPGYPAHRVPQEYPLPIIMRDFPK